MSESHNPFAAAIKPVEREPITRHVDHGLFFQKKFDRERELQESLSWSRQERFDRGILTVRDLDDEELRYGRCRDARGVIPRNSKKTEMLPRDVYEQLVAEHEKRTDEKLRQQLDSMLEVMIEIASDDTNEPGDRLKAATYLFERVKGKTPERVQVAVAKAPWEEMMSGVAQVTRAQHQAIKAGNIVDAEVVPGDGAPNAAAESVGNHEDSRDSGESASAPGGFGGADAGADRGGGPYAGTTSAGQPGDTHAGDVAGAPTCDFGAGYESSPYAAAPTAPTHDAPANSNPVIEQQTLSRSEQIRRAEQHAALTAELRKAKRDAIKSAKAKRIAKKAVAADVLQRELKDVDIQGVQERLPVPARSGETEHGEDG